MAIRSSRRWKASRPGGDVDVACAHDAGNSSRRLARRGFHGDVAFDQRGGLARQRRRAHVGRLAQQAIGDLGRRARADQLQAGLLQVLQHQRFGARRIGRVELVDQRARQVRRPAGGARGQTVELGAERLGPPELVLEAAAPALGHGAAH